MGLEFNIKSAKLTITISIVVCHLIISLNIIYHRLREKYIKMRLEND